MSYKICRHFRKRHWQGLHVIVPRHWVLSSNWIRRTDRDVNTSTNKKTLTTELAHSVKEKSLSTRWPPETVSREPSFGGELVLQIICERHVLRFWNLYYYTIPYHTKTFSLEYCGMVMLRKTETKTSNLKSKHGNCGDPCVYLSLSSLCNIYYKTLKNIW